MKFCLTVVSVVFLLGFAAPCASSPSPTLEDGQDAEILKLGEKIYNLHCRSCHMPYGNSRIKRLRLSDDEWKYGSKLEEIEELIAEGIEATQMQPFKTKLDAKEINAVSVYVLSLSKKNGRQASLPVSKQKNARQASLPVSKQKNARQASLPVPKQKNARQASLPVPKQKNARQASLPDPKQKNARQASLPVPKQKNARQASLPVPSTKNAR